MELQIVSAVVLSCLTLQWYKGSNKNVEVKVNIVETTPKTNKQKL